MEYVGYGVYGVWGIWGTGDMVYGVKYRVMWWWAYIFNMENGKYETKCSEVESRGVRLPVTRALVK